MENRLKDARILNHVAVWWWVLSPWLLPPCCLGWSTLGICAFSLQQWLHDRASVMCSYIHCLPC